MLKITVRSTRFFFFGLYFLQFKDMGYCLFGGSVVSPEAATQEIAPSDARERRMGACDWSEGVTRVQVGGGGEVKCVQH